jgi:glycosyltransferase involved in cell wall biosynthesis
MGRARIEPDARTVNILFLDQFSDLGGAQQCLLDLAPTVQAAGWKVSCAVPGAGRLVEKLRRLDCAVYSLPGIPLAAGTKTPLDFVRFGVETPWLALDISRLVRKSQADLIYVNGPRVLPAAAWVARTSGRPLIFHCHNHLAQWSAVMIAGRSLQFSNARTIACCRHVARPLWSYVDPGRLRVIYNGVAEPEATPAARSGGPRIGVIGRIAPEKGQVEFLQAARLLLARKHWACRFVICGAPLFGDRDAERYAERVREAAHGLQVDFTGWREDVNAVLAGLDLLVVPSLREPGAPRVILEAYAARVPVVAFVSGGIPEILNDGETGFLVEPPTAEALAAKLENLLNAPEQLRDAAECAYGIWKEQFTVERYQREALEVIGLTQTRSATGRLI